jgi:hypothetical protein
VLLLGHEALDGHHVDVVEARLAEQGHEVVLLLADPGVADREDLQEPQELVPGGLGGEGDLAHAVAEQAEGERALPVPLEVHHLAPDGELERVDVEDEGPEPFEHRPEAVPVLGDQGAHDLVRRVVQCEAAGGAGHCEDGRVRGLGRGASAEAALLEGGLRSLGGDVLVLDGRRRRAVRVRSPLY